MRRNNKQVTTYFILFSLLLIGVVYAILQANLQINGTAKIQANTWDIHFDNIQVNENSVSIGTGDSAATIDPENNCKVDFEVTLSIPGDFYEFTIDVVNAGTIDGMIGELNKTLKVNNEVVSEVPDYLNYSVTYADGMEIAENHKIEADTTETYKVRLEFKMDIEELPEETTVVTSLEPQYLQADSSSVVRPNVFVYGTWNQIVDAYNSGNIASLQSAMEAGMVREVQLDMNYDGTPETTTYVRIANLSTPAECLTSGFSQTACGFVIEFLYVLEKRKMNPYAYYDDVYIGSQNRGGWEFSELRAYVNSGKYLEGDSKEIDFTSGGIYKTLPSDLKNTIINTTVVSGRSYYDSANFVTTDKLYLFDEPEIDGYKSAYSHNEAENSERQLDYYQLMGVTKSDLSFAVKNDFTETPTSFWFRSSVYQINNLSIFYFYSAGTSGSASSYTTSIGVSPAFRIAE